MQNRNDLTTGPILKKLLVFFIPIAAGTLFQQLYNAVDAFVVSKYLGTAALAAVGGSPFTVISLVIGFCTALCAGASVVISQLYGAKNYTLVSKAIETSFFFSIVLGLAVGLVLYFFSPAILTLLKTPEDTFADALIYQRIYFCGSIFVLVYNMGASILRSVGNSRFPFVCLFVSCILNIILDVVFVVFFSLGVAGVAWATLIAQLVSAILVTIKLLYLKEDFRLSLHRVRDQMSVSLLKDMLTIGIPAGFQSSMYGISNMILQIGINVLDTVVVASWSMTGKVDGAYWAISSAFGAAITTFIGQNYGAGNLSRVKETSKKGFWLFFGITVCSSAIIMAFARPLLGIFTDDAAVYSTTLHIPDLLAHIILVDNQYGQPIVRFRPGCDWIHGYRQVFQTFSVSFINCFFLRNVLFKVRILTCGCQDKINKKFLPLKKSPAEPLKVLENTGFGGHKKIDPLASGTYYGRLLFCV